MDTLTKDQQSTVRSTSFGLRLLEQPADVLSFLPAHRSLAVRFLMPLQMLADSFDRWRVAAECALERVTLSHSGFDNCVSADRCGALIIRT